jgi:hypothetical protein
MEADERLGTRVMLENESMRVWEHHIPAGTTGHLHLHLRPYISVVVRGQRGETLGGDGDVLEDFDLQPGNVFWFGTERLPEPHALRNTGAEDAQLCLADLDRRCVTMAAHG